MSPNCEKFAAPTKVGKRVTRGLFPNVLFHEYNVKLLLMNTTSKLSINEYNVEAIN